MTTEQPQPTTEATGGASDVERAVRGWQPIETAPKDGSTFLACSGDWMTTCCWNKHRVDWCECGPHYPAYPQDERPEFWMLLPVGPNKY